MSDKTLTRFHEDLRGIANSLIQRVMNRLDDDPETEALFLEWARGFAALEPFNEELWERLRAHVKWPV